MYQEVCSHWFYKKTTGAQPVHWIPFSLYDNRLLEQTFLSSDLSFETLVSTDGGRYDVNILNRQKYSVYWHCEPMEVRRCSWFYKSNFDGKYIPFDEDVSVRLENQYKHSFTTNQWNTRLELTDGHSVLFHSADILVLFPPSLQPHAWENTTVNI